MPPHRPHRKYPGGRVGRQKKLGTQKHYRVPSHGKIEGFLLMEVEGVDRFRETAGFKAVQRKGRQCLVV